MMLKAITRHCSVSFRLSTRSLPCFLTVRHCSAENRRDANQATLDYAMLLDYVRPEMAHRIQQLMDHDAYLQSLTDQIREKQKYHEQNAKQTEHEQPQPHNQKLSNVVMETLENMENEFESDDTSNVAFEPGLTFEDCATLKNLESTFYGPSPLDSFEDLQIDRCLTMAINDMGINIPSHIQQLAIPQILDGHNTVIGAETGTGKTIAYSLPILHKLLNDKTIMNAAYDPISNVDEDGDDDDDRQYHKRHPFEFDAEKKYPSMIIVQPNEHLSTQTQRVLNEILDRYFDYRNDINLYRLKTMTLHGRALLPKSNQIMPDILICTPTALLSNLHKKHSENRHRSFLSKIKYVVLDEADFLTRSGSRLQLRYIFSKLKQLQSQVAANPLKYKLLLPRFIRDSSASLVFKELNRFGKPQMIFVGATIPTSGGRNVAETIRDWLDKAVWVRTPGLHSLVPHTAQEFRYVPRGMEMDILHQLLIQLSKDHLYKNMMNSDDDILFDDSSDERMSKNQEIKRHKKRIKRQKKAKDAHVTDWEEKQKQLHILIFVNTKKFTRECFKSLLDRGWLNTRCIHSQLHREERKQRMKDFEDAVPQDIEVGSTAIRKNVEINESIVGRRVGGGGGREEINPQEALMLEYKEVLNNVHLLVTSDFANRGVDFKNVDIVINANFPVHAVDYLHRAGRTGRGGTSQRGKSGNGRVISFFNEHDLDLAWHIQMSLINQYRDILKKQSGEREDDQNGTEKDGVNGEDLNRIGKTSVRLDDCFGIGQQSMGGILRGKNAKMSISRDYEQQIDLTRVDLEQMDQALVQHIVGYAIKQKWIRKDRAREDSDDKEEGGKREITSEQQQLMDLVKERKTRKRKLRVPWPYRMEFANQ